VVEDATPDWAFGSSVPQLRDQLSRFEIEYVHHSLSISNAKMTARVTCLCHKNEREKRKREKKRSDKFVSPQEK